MQINEHNPSALYQHYHEKCAENVQLCQLFPSNEAKSDSSFMLMLSSEKSNFAKKLNNALSSGAIPVFIDDSEERDLHRLLPLPDLFEWHNAAIFLQHRTMDFQSLNSLLQNVPEWKIYELRRMGRFYFAHFLANPKVLLRTIFSAIRHRLLIVAPPEKIVAADVLLKLMPINGKTETKNLEREQIFNDDVKRLWNMDPTFLDSTSKVQPYWRHSHLQFNQQQINSDFYPKFEQKLSENWQNDEKFTIVLQAYRRDAQLLYTLKTLDGLRRPITEQSYAWPHIHVPVFVVNTSRDSLNDRFLPLSLIRTEAVLSIDDDFNVEHGTIEFSFRIWRENRARIVGPNYRIGYIQHNDNKNLIGIYKGPPRNEPIFQHCQYNIVLTSGAFIHRDFLASYSNEMPSEIRTHVDKITNCEDIGIAFWVSYLSRLGPLKTTQIGNTIGVFTKNTTGLSSRPDHFAQRSECIKLFSQIIGHNPLVITEYRADSLLYKQKAEHGEGVENSKKCFKNE
ncbi:hypothetical protein niasHS_004799 [Heterodera schachtii]|uniref:Glycosyl transferase 64 domain-containing protein n=1 Tax=Heterodera schachtii TaxID=97005 RepID=A0ABD2K0M5_HETSC